MNYQNFTQKSKGVEMLLKLQIIQTQTFMNAVNDLLKKYIDLIHKRQKNYLESGKRDPKRYYIVIDN